MPYPCSTRPKYSFWPIATIFARSFEILRARTRFSGVFSFQVDTTTPTLNSGLTNAQVPFGMLRIFLKGIYSRMVTGWTSELVKETNASNNFLAEGKWGLMWDKGLRTRHCPWPSSLFWAGRSVASKSEVRKPFKPAIHWVLRMVSLL